MNIYDKSTEQGIDKIEKIIKAAADLADFNHTNISDELSEDELDLIVAACSVPDYQDFIKKLKK